MRKFIFCLLIMSLAACSNKKMPPEAEGQAPEDIIAYVAEPEEEENDFFPEEEAELYDYVDHNPLARNFFREVQASSELPGYPANNLIDQTWNSWAEGVPGNGIGESFSFIFWEEYKSTETIAGFVLKNGYGNLNHYSQNNRVKSFKIYVDGNYIETIPIKDSISFEQYIFKNPVVFEELRFVIDDVYPGTAFDDTCIAEISLLYQPVNTVQFYKNILLWFKSRNIYYYENDSKQIASVPNTDSYNDRRLIMEYLPFGILDNIYYDYDEDGVPINSYYDYDFYTRMPLPIKTKIARLSSASSLKFRLNDYYNLPRLDGATAMYPLYSSFVTAVYPKVEPEWEDPEYKHPFFYAISGWAYYPYSDSIVRCSTTSWAFQRLIDGKTDIIFCYAPSEAERSAAAEKGKQFNLTPIAYDAFVFIVNEKNSLNNITQRQIRDIYSGRVTNWKSISGVDEPIIAYQRPENSGSQTTLQSIMGERRLMRPVLEGEYIPGEMGSMIRAISSDYYNYNIAIGYTFLFYLTKMIGNSGTKVLAVDGVAPTSQTIQNKTYPFVQTVYAITTGNESENTRKFIEWILSAQGQELVAKTGYTPVR